MKLHNAVMTAGAVTVGLMVCAACGPLAGGGSRSESGSGSGEPAAATASARPTSLAPGVNPYQLPPEQRPALFDPCTEIPEAALREAGFGPEDKDDSFTEKNEESLKSCGWRDTTTLFSASSYWTTVEQIVAGSKLKQRGDGIISGRQLVFYGDDFDTLKHSCEVIIATSRGTLNFAIDNHSSLNEFRGRRLDDSCDALADLLLPIIPEIPEGVS